MKSAFVLGAFLASVAIAQPHKQHLHAKHHKRDAETTVVITDWVYEYETVDITTTIWVSPGYVEPEITSSTSSPASTTPIATPTSTSSSFSAAQFFEPKSTSSAEAPPPPAPTTFKVSSSTPAPVYVAPTTPSVYVAPVESSSSQYVAPVVVPTTTTPAAVVYTAPAEAATSVAAPPVATTAVSNSGSSSGSSGGPCSSGSPCDGDITYYQAGIGACGWTSDGDTERVVALSKDLMGDKSNGNPYCGKTITITYKGKTTTATVADKCPGCAYKSIDLSNAAFLDLAELSVGRAEVKWWFN